MKRLFITFMAVTALGFAACNESTDTKTAGEATAASSEESAEDRNIRVAKSSMEGINQHNPDIVMKEIAPGFVDYGDGSMEPMRNADSMKVMMKGWMDAFPDFKAENVEYFAEGNKVVAVSDVSGTWKNDFMGMKASGKSFKFKDADIFTFNENGQITEHRNIQNFGLAMGMPMPEQPADK